MLHLFVKQLIYLSFFLLNLALLQLLALIYLSLIFFLNLNIYILISNLLLYFFQ